MAEGPALQFCNPMLNRWRQRVTDPSTVVTLCFSILFFFESKQHTGQANRNMIQKRLLLLCTRITHNNRMNNRGMAAEENMPFLDSFSWISKRGQKKGVMQVKEDFLFLDIKERTEARSYAGERAQQSGVLHPMVENKTQIDLRDKNFKLQISSGATQLWSIFFGE